MKKYKYTIKHLKRDFPNDDVCLDYIFRRKYPHLKQYYRVKGRKCYANTAGKQIHPLAGTIFEKSSTPLTLWFYAIYLFSCGKNGVSAKELERQLGVTYKCAWRIAKHIRSLMGQDKDLLSGTVEVDETYFGGRKVMNEKMTNKSAVMGMVERKGRIRIKKIPNRETHIILNNLKNNVARGSQLMTDEWNAYKKTPKFGYYHKGIKHGKKHYVAGDIHTNTIEGFWSQLKRSINGTYHSVSLKYLQLYVDEFAYRYNHRNDGLSDFQYLLFRLVK